MRQSPQNQMSELVMLIPVLARPHRVKHLLQAISSTTPNARVLFLTDPHDRITNETIQREKESASLQVDAIACGGSYGSKINVGLRETVEPFLFLGADDLLPHFGWYEEAKSHLAHKAEVVGINDLFPRRRQRHATHFLVAREYVQRGTIDGAPGILSEAYSHMFVDDELIATAKYRDVYFYAENAIVEHLHPLAGKGRSDATYEKGFSTYASDRAIFLRRMQLWQNPPLRE